MASQEYSLFHQTLHGKEYPPNASLEEIRSHFNNWMKEFPSDTQVQFEPFSMGKLDACWAFAPDVTRRRILLFFFGGGFTFGSIEAYKNVLGRLSAAANAAVVAVQYRLAPEYPYPAALDDALSAYRWLLHHPYARSRIVLSGISSGSSLVLSLLLRLKIEQTAMPAAAVCLCPWIDLALDGNKLQKASQNNPLLYPSWTAKQYAGEESLANPLLSPLHGDFTDLPPLFIQTSNKDPFYEEATLLAQRTEKQGVSTAIDVWPDLMHAWQLFAPAFPEGQEAIERAGAFVDRLFKC